MSFVDALKLEIEDLERKLEADPTYVKLREAKRLLRAYVGGGDVVATTRKKERARTRPAVSGVSAEILSAAKDCISGKSAPTPTRDIMGYLDMIGVEVGGANKQNVVSSLLSKSEEFVSHGRSGWTIAAPESREIEKVDDADPVGATSSTLFESRTSHPAESPAQGREAGPGGGT